MVRSATGQWQDRSPGERRLLSSATSLADGSILIVGDKGYRIRSISTSTGGEERRWLRHSSKNWSSTIVVRCCACWRWSLFCWRCKREFRLPRSQCLQGSSAECSEAFHVSGNYFFLIWRFFFISDENKKFLEDLLQYYIDQADSYNQFAKEYNEFSNKLINSLPISFFIILRGGNPSILYFTSTDNVFSFR